MFIEALNLRLHPVEVFYVVGGTLVALYCIGDALVYKLRGGSPRAWKHREDKLAFLCVAGISASLATALFAGWDIFWALIIAAFLATVPVLCISLVYTFKEAYFVNRRKKKQKPKVQRQDDEYLHTMLMFAGFVFTHVALLLVAAAHTTPYTPEASKPSEHKTVAVYRGDRLTPSDTEVKSELIGLITHKTSGDSNTTEKNPYYSWQERTGDGEIRNMYKRQSYVFYGDNSNTAINLHVEEVQIVEDQEPDTAPYIIHQVIYTVPTTYKDGEPLCTASKVQTDGCTQNAWADHTKATIHLPKGTYATYVTEAQ